jgi:hypothetical protein
MLAKQMLYHSSHTSNPFCFGYFGDGGLMKYLLRLTLNRDSSELSLPKARITDVSHQSLVPLSPF